MSRVASWPHGKSRFDHSLGKGSSESRSTTASDPARYLVNYADLRAAFGTDQRAAMLHGIGTGAAEGRVA